MPLNLRPLRRKPLLFSPQLICSGLRGEEGGRIVLPGLPDVSREAVQEFPDAALVREIAKKLRLSRFRRQLSKCAQWTRIRLKPDGAGGFMPVNVHQAHEAEN